MTPHQTEDGDGMMDIQRLEALLGLITPEEWREYQGNVVNDDEVIAACMLVKDDAEFIALARNQLPAILARLKELENTVALTQASADGYGSLLLDVQQECIKYRKRLKEQEAEVERLKEVGRRIVKDLDGSCPCCFEDAGNHCRVYPDDSQCPMEQFEAALAQEPQEQEAE